MKTLRTLTLSLALVTSLVILAASTSFALAPKQDDQALAESLANRTEILWTTFIERVLSQAAPLDPKPNAATLMINWLEEPRFPRAFQLSRHEVKIQDQEHRLYALRTGEASVWVMLRRDDTWRVYRASMSKDGKIRSGLSQNASARELRELVNIFVPGQNGTDTVLSRRFSSVAFELTPPANRTVPSPNQG